MSSESQLRTWQLNETSTRYEKLTASPSDETMAVMWFGWSGLSIVVSIFTLMVLVSVAANKRVRQNPFNMYLLFLMIPDIITSLPCGITCLLNGLFGEFYVTSIGCQLQSFYITFGISANAWLNAVTCYQLYDMLLVTKQSIRYVAPQKQTVVKHAVLVYIGSAFLASWSLWDAPWWPHETLAVRGIACLPMDHDPASSAFFYLFFLPFLFGIPLMYVIYVAFQIYRQKLLPRTGHCRLLSIYFLRLATVFFLMWLPGILIVFVFGTNLNNWVFWAGGSWVHLQGGVSAAVSLLKPDVYQAFKEFWYCCYCCCRSNGMFGSGDKQGKVLDRSSSHKRGWLPREVPIGIEECPVANEEEQQDVAPEEDGRTASTTNQIPFVNASNEMVSATGVQDLTLEMRPSSADSEAPQPTLQDSDMPVRADVDVEEGRQVVVPPTTSVFSQINTEMQIDSLPESSQEQPNSPLPFGMHSQLVEVIEDALQLLRESLTETETRSSEEEPDDHSVVSRAVQSISGALTRTRDAVLSDPERGQEGDSTAVVAGRLPFAADHTRRTRTPGPMFSIPSHSVGGGGCQAAPMLPSIGDLPLLQVPVFSQPSPLFQTTSGRERIVDLINAALEIVDTDLVSFSRGSTNEDAVDGAESVRSRLSRLQASFEETLEAVNSEHSQVAEHRETPQEGLDLSSRQRVTPWVPNIVLGRSRRVEVSVLSAFSSTGIEEDQVEDPHEELEEPTDLEERD